MQVPFLDLYLKLRDKVRELRGVAPVEAPRPPVRSTIAVAKPESERLSKTVLPNMTRKVAAPEPVGVSAGGMASAKLPGGEKLSRPRIAAPAMGAWSGKPATSNVLVPEQKAERSIFIRLRDVIDKLPVGCIKSPETFDCDRNILLRASELEKGMSEGKPTVSLASIYQQAPEIFVHRPAPDDCTVVPLPFDKVLTQFMTLQPRADQVCDEIVPQVETPILQVTLEDTERFGTTIEPLQTSPLPPVRVETATAQAIAAAEPEASISETVKPRTIRPAISLVDPTPPKKQPPPGSLAAATQPPPKIPADLPPNGTGAPASEIVPALSGPPVPTVSPPAMPAVPPRIPFRVTAPSEDIRPKFIRVPGSEPREAISPDKSVMAKEDEPRVALPLQAVLHELPAFQLNGSPEAVPDDARVELPLSLIEPQLASGRVVVSPTVLQKAIPQDYRALLKVDPVETPVTLPLQEVLKNLPAGVLQMRPDQEQIELEEKFETPFSIKADEDAKRFEAGTKETAKIPEAPAKPSPTRAKPSTELAKPAPAPEGSEPKTKEPETKEKLDDKSLLGRANALPGVAACAVLFADGLALAGKLPAEVSADGLCAMLPAVLQKIDKHLLETKLGALNGLTLHTAKAPLTFLQRGNVCLAVLHAESELPGASRDQLVFMLEQLSHIYSEEEPLHVDH